MIKRKNLWQPQPGNLVYLNRKKEIAISSDKLQWIVKKGESYSYYRNMSQILVSMLEDEVKEIFGSDTKSLLTAIEKATKRIEKLSSEIKLGESEIL